MSPLRGTELCDWLDQLSGPSTPLELEAFSPTTRDFNKSFLMPAYKSEIHTAVKYVYFTITVFTWAVVYSLSRPIQATSLCNSECYKTINIKIHIMLDKGEAYFVKPFRLATSLAVVLRLPLRQ